MKDFLREFPKGTIMVNGSIDCIHHTLKKQWYPLGLPFVLKKGERIVITCKGVWKEKDE